MITLRFSDTVATFIVLLTPLSSGLDGLELHSCWRFYPNRQRGEPIPLHALPWQARQQVAEHLNNPMP